MINAVKKLNQQTLVSNLATFRSSHINTLFDTIVSFNGKNMAFFDQIKEQAYVLMSKLENSLKESKISFDSPILQKFNPTMTLKKCTELLKETKLTKENLSDYKDAARLLKLLNNKTEADKMFQKLYFLKSLRELNLQIDSFETKTEEIHKLANSYTTCLSKELETIFPEKVAIKFVSPDNFFTTNPHDLIFHSNIANNSQKSYTIDNTFAAFVSNKNDELVAYPTTAHHIVIYDLSKEKKVHDKKAHTAQIYIVRHFYDPLENDDYVVSTSYDKGVCVLSCNGGWAEIIKINNAHGGYYLYSSCMLFDTEKSKQYLVTSAASEPIKIWDIKGSFIRNLNEAKDYTYTLETWYNQETNTHYIINGNSIEVKIYEFETGVEYRKFKGNPQTWHMGVQVFVRNNIPYLLDTDGNGCIRVWDINANVISREVKMTGLNLRGFVFWDETNIIVSSSDKLLKIINIDTLACTGSLASHTAVVCNVQKLKTTKFGDVLFSAAIDGNVKMWKIK